MRLALASAIIEGGCSPCVLAVLSGNHVVLPFVRLCMERRDTILRDPRPSRINGGHMEETVELPLSPSAKGRCAHTVDHDVDPSLKGK